MCEVVELRAGLAAIEQAAVRMHHALWIAGGAGGKEHCSYVVGPRLLDPAAEEVGILLRKRPPGFHQDVERSQACLLILAQPARIVVVDAAQLRALGPDLKQLVDLLLVLGEGEADFRIVDGENAFSRDRILVQRDRHRAERLHRQHRCIQARPIRADDDHVVAGDETGLVQTACNLFDHLRHRGPAMSLPDAVFLLANRRISGTLCSVLEEQSRERGLHSVSLPAGVKSSAY